MLFIKTILVSLITTSVGFIKFVYFISLGYGFSVAGIGIFLLITQKNSKMSEKIYGLLYFLYGMRLALFLLYRDLKSPSYNEKMKEERKKIKEMKFGVKIMIWISCALLYSCQTSPLTFRFTSIKRDKKEYLLSYVGIIIAFFGFLMESRADYEKNAAKKLNPNRFVDSGLYKFVRCPNYLGEILFWTGNFLGGIKIYNGLSQWIISLIGYICIIFVMLGGTRTLEIRQNKSYGKDSEYQKYVKTTPILIPFIPLYSVEKYTWMKA